MSSPLRAQEALELQAQRDQAVINNLAEWRNGLELEKYQGLADNLKKANLLGSHFDFLNTYQNFSSAANLATFFSAVSANSCKCVLLGHSIAEGQNQNWPSANFYNILKDNIANAFPSVSFDWVNLALAGRKATQYGSAANILNNTGYCGKVDETYASSGFFRAAKSASYYVDSWIDKTGSLNGSVLNKSWRNHVLDQSPDIVFIQFDLNDVDIISFKDAMQFIIDDFKNHADFAVKRPSLVLVSSHTGLSVPYTVITPELVRKFAVILRELARVNKLPLIDGGRVYDILTTGYDPVVKLPTGEAFFKYNGLYDSAESFVLNTQYWQNIVGVGYSPSGSTVRDQAGGQLVTLRKREAQDVVMAGIYTSYNASSEGSFFYRANKSSLTNLAERYEVRLSGSLVSLIYQAEGGAQSVVATAAISAITSNSSHHVKVIVRGANHKVLVNGIEKININDWRCFNVGYAGIGIKNSGAFNKGTNLSNGFYIEFLDSVYTQKARFSDADLLGVINDFASSADSMGGNGINHLTNLGSYYVYLPAIGVFIKQLQAFY